MAWGIIELGSAGYVLNYIVFGAVGVAIPVIGVLFAICFLWYFMSQEDHGCTMAVCPKVVFVISFALGVIGVLLMPYSVASAKVGMPDAWNHYQTIVFQIFYSFAIFTIVIVVPFTICYYEAEDPDLTFEVKVCSPDWCKGICKQACCGIVYSIVITIIFVAVFCVFYFTLGYAQIEYTAIQVPITGAQPSRDLAFEQVNTACGNCLTFEDKWDVQASAFIYLVAMVSMVGYIVFVVCGGCGMMALPCSCICTCIRRPKSLTKEQLFTAKRSIRDKARTLLDIGKDIDKAISDGKFTSPNHRVLFQDFRDSVMQIEAQKRHMDAAEKMQGAAPVLRYLCSFLCGLIGFFVSGVWCLHVAIFLGVKETPLNWSFGFLNIVFTFADQFVFPLGTVLYAVLCCHLVLSILSGFFVIAARIPIISVHPLIPHDTMMSSLLFNAALFLLASIPVNQFAADAFSDFAADSVMDQFFGGVIKNLKFFEYFYKYVYQYAFLLCAAVAIPAVSILYACPRKTKEQAQLQETVRNLLG